uniref:Uncharacterized protein n=1 Tax=Anguilla anguilla TaxID=7936 RepID=A0A0E9RBS8_ANGAN
MRTKTLACQKIERKKMALTLNKTNHKILAVGVQTDRGQNRQAITMV